MQHLPLLGICGYSGSGKTTLIRQLLPRLAARGMRVAVIKHDVHGLSVDRKGKDSDAFFRAGADVLASGPGEVFLRSHVWENEELSAMVRQLATSHDIILVEGFKTVAFPHKVWLRRTADDRPPPEVGDVALDLKPGSQRESAVTALLEDVLKAASRSTPVYAGILIGGRSERMGRPKHLLRIDGRTWLERTVEVMQPLVDEVVLLGNGRVPSSLKKLAVLPDSKEGGGPLAGMLAAMRWAPGASWVFLACDLPLISRPAVKWILAARVPGVWAVLPKTDGGIEPLLAWYDFRARPLLESCTGPCQMARSAKVLTPSPPRRLAGAWINCNTPKDLVTIGDW